MKGDFQVSGFSNRVASGTIYEMKNTREQILGEMMWNREFHFRQTYF